MVYLFLISYDLVREPLGGVRAFRFPYFPVFSPNIGKCGSGKTTYLDTFGAVFR